MSALTPMRLSNVTEVRFKDNHEAQFPSVEICSKVIVFSPALGESTITKESFAPTDRDELYRIVSDIVTALACPITSRPNIIRKIKDFCMRISHTFGLPVIAKTT